MDGDGGGSGSQSKVPAGAVIDNWTAHDWSDGLMVDRLLAHDRVTARTRNSVYEFIVTDPREGEVLVRGGQFFPEFTKVRVAGCSLGGGFLKVRGIYAGFRIEIVTDEQMIITSPVANVTLTHGDARASHLM
jgi:hypothetical protein